MHFIFLINFFVDREYLIARKGKIDFRSQISDFKIKNEEFGN